MSNKECTCKEPNYVAFTGRCTICGGFHKKELEVQFDYESRKMEEGKPVCVACINESRAHQIPGKYEHICGKQVATPNTQLPANVVSQIEKEANSYIEYSSNMAPHIAYRAGATEYATKLHQVEQEKKNACDTAILMTNKNNECQAKLWDAFRQIETTRSLLESAYRSYNSGKEIDQEILDDIKQYLDGK